MLQKIEEKKKREYFTAQKKNIKATTTKYLVTKIINRGWIFAATEDINTPPRRNEVESLIKKAWQKPSKIHKFYIHIKQREILTNTIVAIKACITLQHYFYRGPANVFIPFQHENLPVELLPDLYKNWVNINEKKEINKTFSKIRRFDNADYKI